LAQRLRKREIMDKLDQLDLMQGKVYEAEMKQHVAQLETHQVKFQAWLDLMWAKYGKIKGEDQLQPDGTWVKAEVK
jgi:hypothetical protein